MTATPTFGTWYPIDTAPTDEGIVVLLWDGKPTIGWYIEYIMGYAPLGSSSAINATHWMPLPDGPEMEEDV